MIPVFGCTPGSGNASDPPPKFPQGTSRIRKAADAATAMIGVMSWRHGERLERQHGLTLIEIMVTVFILCLGLLGLAGLQMTGLKSNRNAYYQTVATQAVQDIAERLHTDTATSAAITGGVIREVGANSAKCDKDVEYTFDNRVACISSSLPGGQARIVELNASPKALTIAMLWSDPQLNGAKGWGADVFATGACGEAVINTSCSYTVYRP